MRAAVCVLVAAGLLLACASQPTVIVVTQEVLITSEPVYLEVTPAVTNTPQPTPTPRRTSTPRPTEVPPCAHASDVTLADVGRTMAICGRVTRVGNADCRNCKYGRYWFMVLDKTFTIYAYDWEFLAEWVSDDCMKFSYEVERIGSHPVFNIKTGDIMGSGSQCHYKDGGLVCSGGMDVEQVNSTYCDAS
jgi:hypothetical protein